MSKVYAEMSMSLDGFITGPNVITQVTGEKVTADALGGADAHMAVSGVNHFVADDDAQAVLIAQKLLAGQTSLTIRGTLDYQACDDKVCYAPTSVPLTFTFDFTPLVRP